MKESFKIKKVFSRNIENNFLLLKITRTCKGFVMKKIYKAQQVINLYFLFCNEVKFKMKNTNLKTNNDLYSFFVSKLKNRN